VELIGYAIHNGRKLFEPLASRMDMVPELRVIFCVDIGRQYGDTSPDSEIVRRFATDFRARHWPWSKLPEVFYDPRSLVASGPLRASLHAKCVVVDREVALVTSANFTEAAQHRNIEAGVLIRHRGMVERIASYFEGLRTASRLLACPLT
jgi:phosphatidylserine/phosphatidylglycerophosphate/cardiolipin synthase-like enzyme